MSQQLLRTSCACVDRALLFYNLLLLESLKISMVKDSVGQSLSVYCTKITMCSVAA